MSRDIELLAEIRDLLLVIAEPIIAKRDAKLRTFLRTIVGGSVKRAACVQLMDGTRTQAALTKATGIDQGNLSRFVKKLVESHLLSTDEKHPKLLLKIPPTFFDEESTSE
jgi:hypothetical protein